METSLFLNGSFHAPPEARFHTRNAVHAVSLSRRLGSVGEDVSQVGTATVAPDFSRSEITDEVQRLHGQVHGTWEGVEERRPSRSRIKLRVGGEQWMLAGCTAVRSWVVVLVQGGRAGPFGPSFDEHVVLFWREQLLPLFGIPFHLHTAHWRLQQSHPQQGHWEHVSRHSPGGLFPLSGPVFPARSNTYVCVPSDPSSRRRSPHGSRARSANHRHSRRHAGHQLPRRSRFG
eukprot:scaffold287_cov337-Pavlova_lutheri.AAC.146